MPVKMFFLFAAAAFCIVRAQRQTLDKQTVGVIRVSGKVKVRATPVASPVRLTRTSTVPPGGSVITEGSAMVQLGIEPAVTVTLHDNSIVTFEKMLIDYTRKTARSELALDKGVMMTVMPAYSVYNILFTVQTPSAYAHLRKAVAKVYVQGNNTHVEVFRGTAKVRDRKSGRETTLAANQATVAGPRENKLVIRSFTDPSQRENVDKGSTASIAMLSISSKTVAREDLHPLSDYIAQEMEKQSNTEVFFLDDVAAMLRTEGMSAALNCMTDSCLSLIGKALGVDWVVIGRLGKLGSKYIFNLHMIDAMRDRTEKRANVTVDQDVGKVIEEIPGMVTTLVTGTAGSSGLRMASGAEKSSPAPGEDNTSMQRGSPKNMVWIPAGGFMMGAGDSATAKFDERPRHRVKLDGFYMDQYEVTRADFERVMKYNPSSFKGCLLCPVDNVSWNEADTYCKRVGKRLPTEAEWEYACRAGTETEFHYGNFLSSSQANFDGRKPFGGVPAGPYRNKVTPIGSFKPNALGLYDMHGNVMEWCADYYDSDYYKNAPAQNPAGPEEGKFRVMRGGAWNQAAEELRCARRRGYEPSLRFNFFGFRCVKDAQ